MQKCLIICYFETRLRLHDCHCYAALLDTVSRYSANVMSFTFQQVQTHHKHKQGILEPHKALV